MNKYCIPAFLILIFAASRAAAQDAGWKISSVLRGADRDARWIEDVRQLGVELPAKHKNLFFKLKEVEFRKSVELLIKDVPKIKDHEVLVRLMSIVASVGDSHTVLLAQNGRPALLRFPIEFGWFEDGLFVIASELEQKELIGGKLIKVGSVPVEDAMNAIAGVFPVENDSMRIGFAPKYLFGEVLASLGLASSPDAAHFTIQNADRKNIDFNAKAGGGAARMINWLALSKSPPPLRFKKSGAYWSDLVPKTKVLYIQYNQCKDATDLPMAKFATMVAGFIKELAIERVVVDLRNNGGGDSRVAAPLIDALGKSDVINKKGRLYVLIGRNTFSSAQLNAAQFRKSTEAILVGEPTGQSPNHYGEMQSFQLKNTGLNVTYSTKYFSTGDAGANTMVPDILVPITSRDFFNNIDAALDAAVAGALPKK